MHSIAPATTARRRSAASLAYCIANQLQRRRTMPLSTTSAPNTGEIPPDQKPDLRFGEPDADELPHALERLVTVQSGEVHRVAERLSVSMC
jgi:hypothetical protein